MTGTPVPAASSRITSPIHTGQDKVISFRDEMMSKILSFGMSEAVLQDTVLTPEMLPVTLTVVVTTRVGEVTSFLA